MRLKLDPNQVVTLNILSIVHGLNSSICILVLAVTNEAEATAAAGVPVLDNNLWSLTSDAYRHGGSEHCLQLPRPGRTPQTWHVGHHHRYAMRDH